MPRQAPKFNINLPKDRSLKAYFVEQYRKDAPLNLKDIEKPEPNAFDVLIEIHAFGINPIDCKLRDGAFKAFMPYKPPFILGHECAGVVVKIGANVDKFKIGDEVYARPSDFHIGTFAEYIAVNQNDVALKPAQISMSEAASLPLVSLTAWQVLKRLGNVKSGQKVFIQAGSGGVGTIAIQIAKHLGAYVATTASAGQFELLKSLGADLVIDYRSEDFADILLDYDFVLHNQDDASLLKAFDITKKGGQVVSIAGPADPHFAKEAKLNPIIKAVIWGLSFKARRYAKKRGVQYHFHFMKPSGAQLSEIAKMVENGYISPIIDKIFTFKDTNQAMEFMASGRAKGKIVINTQQS